MTTNDRSLPRGEFPALSFWVMTLGMTIAPTVGHSDAGSRPSGRPSSANKDSGRERVAARDFMLVAGE